MTCREFSETLGFSIILSVLAVAFPAFTLAPGELHDILFDR